jgi:hypothetical protein
MASYMDPGTAPRSTVAEYEEPYAGAMRRGFLESAANLAKQPIPIPVEKVAGLDPYEMRARQLAGGLGGFTPYLGQGAQMMQAGAGYYTPGGISQFYNPFEQDVVQQTMQDAREENARRGIADRDRAISQGAFGGSRGRLMEQERERAFGRGMMEGIGGLRSQGWGQAMQGAQTAGQGLGAMGRNFAGLGTTGQQNLMNQIDVFNRMGGVGRGIQDRMYGAQYGAAQKMAQEPWGRMNQWQNMLGMLPQTLSRSTWNPMASNFDLFGGLASIYPQLGGLDKVLSAATGQDDNIISDLAIQERGAFGGG